MPSYEEPAPKRKTLVERAGETRSNATNLLSQSRSYFKGVSNVKPVRHFYYIYNTSTLA